VKFSILVVAVAVLAGCGGSRGAYVRANERVFKELPRFPGTHLTGEKSFPYYGESDQSPTLGYSTVYTFTFPAAVSGSRVGSFFEQRLNGPWVLYETLGGSPLGGGISNFRRGRSEVSINLDNARFHRFEIGIDHAYFGKLGRCGIPGGCDSSPAWVAIRKSILSCHAKTVSQTHSRNVVVTLKDGRTISAKEAAIDAVSIMIRSSRCQPPPIYATE
jgi:hypothetical protein